MTLENLRAAMEALPQASEEIEMSEKEATANVSEAEILRAEVERNIRFFRELTAVTDFLYAQRESHGLPDVGDPIKICEGEFDDDVSDETLRHLGFYPKINTNFSRKYEIYFNVNFGAIYFRQIPTEQNNRITPNTNARDFQLRNVTKEFDGKNSKKRVLNCRKKILEIY